MPGSTVITSPSDSVLVDLADTEGASCTSSPTPCPRECPKYSPNPAPEMMSRLTASRSAHAVPGRTAATPACWARRTTSYASRSRSPGVPRATVRVQPDAYPPTIARDVVREGAVRARGHDRVEGHAVRAGEPHRVLQVRGDLPLATARRDPAPGQELRPGGVDDATRALDHRELSLVLRAPDALH